MLNCLACGAVPPDSEHASAVSKGWYWCRHCRDNVEETQQVFCQDCGKAPRFNYEQQRAMKKGNFMCAPCSAAVRRRRDEQWWRVWQEEQKRTRRQTGVGSDARARSLGAVPKCRVCGESAGRGHACSLY